MSCPDPDQVTAAWAAVGIVGATLATIGILIGLFAFDPKVGTMPWPAVVLVWLGALILAVAIIGATPEVGP